MALPKIALRGRKIILLSGYKRDRLKGATDDNVVSIASEEKLRKAAKRDPDAIAFGYVQGEWVASA